MASHQNKKELPIEGNAYFLKLEWSRDKIGSLYCVYNQFAGVATEVFQLVPLQQ